MRGIDEYDPDDLSAILNRKGEGVHPAERLPGEYIGRCDVFASEQRPQLCRDIEACAGPLRFDASTQSDAIVNADACHRSDLRRERGPTNRSLPGEHGFERDAAALF